jgi:hypothetical protein
MSDEQELTPEWRDWLLDNARTDVTRDELIATLVQAEVPDAVAAREVDAARAAAFEERARRLQNVLDLQRAVRATARERGEIERRRDVDADELLRGYWRASWPVVLEDAMARWPALERWSPRALKERFGEVRVRVQTGRDADPLADQHLAAHREEMPLADYIDAITTAGESNDLYLVARDRAFDSDGLLPLLDDVVAPPYHDAARLPRGCSLWLGPAGTRTPLHHDQTNNLMCLVFGRKVVHLASPTSPALVERTRGLWSELDLEDLEDLDDDERAALEVFRVEMGPGDALFVPAGWWHQVRATEVSLHLSLTAFRWPNHFPGFLPGAYRARVEDEEPAPADPSPR